MSGDEMEWADNPMEQDYYSLNFNCYMKGPGARMPMNRQPAARKDPDRPLDPLRLYVAQIPLDITENGLRNYMSSVRCPAPASMRLMRGKMGSTPCLYQYAFLTFENTRDASEALQLLNRKEPFYFKVNFANKPGEKERMEKLRESQLKVRNVEKDFEQYLKMKGTQKNEWQQCTTFTDDNDNEATTPSFSGLTNKSDDHKLSTKPSYTFDCNAPLRELIDNELVKFLESKNKSCKYCSLSPYIDHVHYIIDEMKVYNPIADLPVLNDVLCQYCDGRTENIFQLCEKCKVAVYCSKFCQVNDWSRHSNNCNQKSETLLK